MTGAIGQPQSDMFVQASGWPPAGRAGSAGCFALSVCCCPLAPLKPFQSGRRQVCPLSGLGGDQGQG